MANTELLTKVRDKIVSEPETFDMNDWFKVDTSELEVGRHLFALNELPCGTTMCIAGWATMLSGDRVFVNKDTSDDCYSSATVLPQGMDPRSPRRLFESVSDRAAALLGLNIDVARWLFVVDDEDALWAIDQFIAGRGDDEDSFEKVVREQFARQEERRQARGKVM